MSDHAPAPEAPSRSVADAVRGNWVDSRAPAWARPYLRLSRADRPVGTWLLYIPCLWGLFLSAAQSGSLGCQGLWIGLSAGAGAWLMRGAGCSWNDITDREYDAQVRRTASRPLPSGQVSLRGAYAWLGLQAALGATILFTYNLNAVLLGIFSLSLVAIYPFAKRFTWWPQVFLGLAFNWGALLVWTAHHGALAWPAIWLYLGGIFWTLFYDTIYAHQDREDDALIGVKSTARLFGDKTDQWLKRFEIATAACLSLAVITALWPLSWGALLSGLLGVILMAAHLRWQRRRLEIDNPDLCLVLFRANRDSGLIFAGLLLIALAW